jgi:hypothetical protein
MIELVNTLARRMFGLVEPIAVIPYVADEPNEAMYALGFTNYWDTYFAGRAAPLGTSVPAEWCMRSSTTSRRARWPATFQVSGAAGRACRSAAGLREGATTDPREPHRPPAFRGDGHISALMAEGIGGLEAHVLVALDLGMPAEKFGRIHHLPAAQLG